MHTWWTRLLVVAAVIVFGAAGYLAVHQDPVRDAGQTPGYTASSRSSVAPPTIPPSVARSANPSAAPSVRARVFVVAFLGDDYTAGVGASAPSRRFSSVLARQLGVTEKNFGVDATGYAIVPESGAGEYATRIDRIVAVHPDLVVVSGGRNDWTDFAPTLAFAATDLFATLHARLPRARLIAVAPWWGDSPPRPEIGPVAAAVSAAVRAVGGTYLALPDPLLGHPNWMADEADPNDAGYAALAASLKPAIAAQLARLS